jgi:glycosyltransferase involved in cell wall biosynthesis
MTDARVTVLADMRWPLHTGIGQVQEAYVARKPPEIALVDLNVAGPIGSPLSPLRIALAIWRSKRADVPFWSAGFIPPLVGCNRAVVIVHDLTHLKYYNWLRRIYYALILKPLYRRCAAVICVSNFTHAEFLAWSNANPSRVHVIKNGIPSRFIENKLAHVLPYKYLLYPGNHRNYKNLDRLIRAFAKSGIGKCGIHLLLTGDEYPALRRVIDENNLRALVHFAGHVPTDQLPMLYRGAEAIVFVSLYEGFGLPILEAMASDVPVVTSATSAMPEVAGDAALVVDPHSVDAIANALVRITTDECLRSDLVAKGRRRLKEFNWDRSAEEFWRLMVKIYRQDNMAWVDNYDGSSVATVSANRVRHTARGPRGR